MRALKLTWILFIVCLLVSSTTSFAAKPIPPEDGTGTLTGKVLIAGSRTAIANATVTAEGDGAPYTTTTSSTGVYTINPIPGGYTVTATADGYNSQTFSVTVRAGKRTKLNFGLSEAVTTEGVLDGTVTDAISGVFLDIYFCCDRLSPGD